VCYAADRQPSAEMIYLNDDDAYQAAEKRLLDMLMPPVVSADPAFDRTREKLLGVLREGKLDERLLELDIVDKTALNKETDRIFDAPLNFTPTDPDGSFTQHVVQQMRSVRRREKMSVKSALDRLYQEEVWFREFAKGFEEGFFKSDEPTAAVKLFHQGFLNLLERDPDYIHQLSHRQFEELILELLIRYGLCAELTAQTRDGGCDIIAVSTDALGITTKYVVEAKHFRPPNKVGVNIVRQVNTVRLKERGHHGVIVTSSYFTKDAVLENARYYGLELKDFERLSDWIKHAPRR